PRDRRETFPEPAHERRTLADLRVARFGHDDRHPEAAFGPETRTHAAEAMEREKGHDGTDREEERDGDLAHDQEALEPSDSPSSRNRPSGFVQHFREIRPRSFPPGRRSEEHGRQE